VLQPQLLNLNTVLKEILAMLTRVLPEGVVVELRTDPNLKDILADRGLVEQVVMNLVVNARDAMPTGGTLTLETGMSSLDDEAAPGQPRAAPGEHAVLRVRDTGTGMTPEVMQHLFEPFFTTKEPGKGTGLGLSTVYGIVKQHGGQIQVQSTPNAGTEFIVFWPVRAAATPVEQPRAAAPLGGTETILVVDDNADVLRVMSDVLRGAGYRVIAAKGGAEAMEAFQAEPDAIAGAVLDLMMPRMTGIECYQRLTAVRPGLPVLFCSGWSSPEYNRFLEERHLPLLAKPHTPAQLLESLRKALDARPAGADPADESAVAAR
jgi:CheY-like chemotaxis protein